MTSLIISIIEAIVALSIAFPKSFPAFLTSWIIGLVQGLENNIQQAYAVARRVYTDQVLPAVAVYLLIMLIWLAFSCLLILIGGVIFSIGWLFGLSVLLLIIGLYLIFLIPGLFRAILKKRFLSKILRNFVICLAGLGIVGLIHPELITFKLLIILSLLAFLLVGTKSTIINWFVKLPVGLICLITIWNFVAPDHFRSVYRNVKSYGMQNTASNDRTALINEGEAQATYGRLLKDVKVAYRVTRFNEDDGSIAEMKDLPIFLSKDSVFLVINQKKEVSCFEGQTFIEIKLQKNNGSYVTGTKVWIDADLIQVGDRKTIEGLVYMEREQKNLSTASQPSINQSQTIAIPGSYNIGDQPLYKLEPGQETALITVPVGTKDVKCAATADFDLVKKNGDLIHCKKGVATTWPTEFKIRATSLSLVMQLQFVS